MGQTAERESPAGGHLRYAPGPARPGRIRRLQAQVGISLRLRCGGLHRRLHHLSYAHVYSRGTSPLALPVLLVLISPTRTICPSSPSELWSLEGLQCTPFCCRRHPVVPKTFRIDVFVVHYSPLIDMFFHIHISRCTFLMVHSHEATVRLPLTVLNRLTPRHNSLRAGYNYITSIPRAFLSQPFWERGSPANVKMFNVFGAHLRATVLGHAPANRTPRP